MSHRRLVPLHRHPDERQPELRAVRRPLPELRSKICTWLYSMLQTPRTSPDQKTGLIAGPVTGAGRGEGDRRGVGVLCPTCHPPRIPTHGGGAREVFDWVMWGVLVPHRFSSPDSGSAGGALEVFDWVLWGTPPPNPRYLAHVAPAPPSPTPSPPPPRLVFKRFGGSVRKSTWEKGMHFITSSDGS